MNFLLATGNPHKVREFRQVLEPLGVRLESLGSLETVPPEPTEDGDTFEANARIKALAYAGSTGRACIAEDSGLEVDALGGAPGVYSARYAGADGDRDTRDAANNQKLLREIADVPTEQRTARFVCAVCVVMDGEVVFETRGTYEGRITDEPAGDNGFGYDPLLFLPDVGKTSAQLCPDEKNARSHRGAAVRALAAWLNAR